MTSAELSKNLDSVRIKAEKCRELGVNLFTDEEVEALGILAKGEPDGLTPKAL